MLSLMIMVAMSTSPAKTLEPGCYGQATQSVDKMGRPADGASGFLQIGSLRDCALHAWTSGPGGGRRPPALNGTWLRVFLPDAQPQKRDDRWSCCNTFVAGEAEQRLRRDRLGLFVAGARRGGAADGLQD